MDEDIQADHIDRAESRRLGSANQGSRQPVNFFDRESALPHQLNGLQRSKQADPIRDEIGGVFRAHDPFAQDDFGESLKFRERVGVRFGRRNDFEQLHISRRIEEMRSKPALPEIVAPVLCKSGDREARSVRRHERAWLSGRVDGLEQFPFDFEVFHHGFDDPIGILDASDVVVEGAYADLPYVFWHEERRRRALFEATQSGSSLLLSHVQQKYGQAGIRHVPGDLRSHRARAENRNFPDHFSIPLIKMSVTG